MLGFVDLSWAYAGFCWVVFGLSWDYVASLGLLRAYVHFILGLCWTILGLCWGLLGRLGPMLAHLGTMLGLPGFYVGPSWLCVGLSWGRLGTMLGLCWPSLGLCWAFLGSMLGHLGSVLAYLGAMLRRLGTMQNEERTSKCKSCMKTCFQGSFSRYLRCFLHIARFRSASLKTTKKKTHFLQQLDSL